MRLVGVYERVRLELTVAEPLLQVAPVDDAEDQDNVVAINQVIHHAVVTDPQPMEGVRRAADGLGRFGAPRVRSGSGPRKLEQRAAQSVADVAWQPFERPSGRGRELDAVRPQPSCSRELVLPRA